MSLDTTAFDTSGDLRTVAHRAIAYCQPPENACVNLLSKPTITNY
jgi:hypothetical protein